jgi:hypothetical protein
MNKTAKDQDVDDTAVISPPAQGLYIPSQDPDKSLRSDIRRNIESRPLVQYYKDTNQKSLKTKDIPF